MYINSKEKIRYLYTLVIILCRKLIINVKTSIIWIFGKRNVIATTLVTILFTIILLITLDKVIENSKMGVYEKFYGYNKGELLSNKTQLNNSVSHNKSDVIKKDITNQKSEHLISNVMSSTDDKTSEKDKKISDFVALKVNNINKKIKEDIKKEKLKKEKLEKEKLEKEKALEESKNNKESVNNQENSLNQSRESQQKTDITTNSNQIPSEWRVFNMVASAYDLSVESCGKTPDDPYYGMTYSGTRATKGRTIAVDPSVIALGSEVYIEIIDPNFASLSGYYIAEDIGGAIKGNRIDVFVGDNATEYAYQFGMQDCKVYIK